MGKSSSEIGQELAEKTLRELGLTLDKNGKLRETKGNYGNKNSFSRRPPVTSRVLPFRIPVIEKTTRQAQSTQGYKASAHWQTASLLRDLILLYLEIVPKNKFRTKTQLEDAARSTVSTIEEGWARPSTKEYLDYLGFSQASLAEIRGDTERLHTDGLLKSSGDYGNIREFIPTPSRNFPYPPVNSRKNPIKYGRLRDKLREYTGKVIKPEDLTYELFAELVNKTDYLLKKAVYGLQEKVIREEKDKFAGKVRSSWKPWKK